MQSIQEILKEQIKNQDAVFVFPTDIACQKWADWVVKNTGVKAVAMERFLAWDKFKGECIRAESADLKTVPSLMRKIFADTLIQKNAGKPFFKSLIIEKYADEAGGFADWIASILPSLKMWKTLHDKEVNAAQSLSFDDDSLQQFYDAYKKSDFTDDEDHDLALLFEDYSRFLEENRLFDPAWVEPDFSGDGREYYLVYPETLEDWEQYRYKLSRIEKIHFVSVPAEEGEYEAHFFENSSVEVKDVALFLREMHEKSGIEWSEMAVNVPNLDNYGSYIDREFALYGIPRSLRYSRPLSSYGAGIFFSQLSDCVENQFSYESIKNLLLNEELPWTNKPVIENLLLFGRMNNCICTAGGLRFENGRAYTVWDEAFLHPTDDQKTGLNKDQLIKNLYQNLAELIPPLVRAESFEKIRLAYEKFRETFFDMAEFQNMILSNNVLSRCITSLNELVELEEDFPNYKVADPFAFFVSQLSRVQYLSQGEARAVQVYPYKSAPASPYKIHVVVDSTQDSLSVSEQFKPLDFMNENKRRIFMKMGEIDQSLGFSDSDPSYDFVKLYQHSATEKAYFTASRHAYNGEYGFAYGKLDKMGEAEVLSRTDTIALEKERFRYLEHNIGFEKQAAGFASWKKTHQYDAEDTGEFVKDEKLTSLIQSRLSLLKENGGGHLQKNPLLLNRVKVSQTTLKNYFSCPRRWLFKDVLKIAPLDNEAELIDEFVLGRVNHKVFELFFAALHEERQLLAPGDEGRDKLGETFRRILIKSINTAVSLSDSNSAFRELFGKSGEKLTVSQTTIKIISSQYIIDDEARAGENANFRMLEKSIAGLCSLFRGYKVYAVEKEVEALPKDENGNDQEGYYFSGTIDCILASSNESEYVIVDYKTSSIPKNLLVKEKKKDRPEQFIDFQMPMYLYLLENSCVEKERLPVSTALFYSIKKAEAKFFLGNPPEENKNKISPEEVKLAKAEMLSLAKRFYDEISAERFAVDSVNQSRAVCASKTGFTNCIDYQAVCRRFFTVSGE